MKILLVDDDPGIRLSVQRSLEFEGYRVTTAEDGEAALIAIAAAQYDCVILDISMPRLDGLGRGLDRRQVGAVAAWSQHGPGAHSRGTGRDMDEVPTGGVAAFTVLSHDRFGHVLLLVRRRPGP